MQNERGISRWQGSLLVLTLGLLGSHDAVALRRSERPNEAPSISGTPPTVATAGQPYAFRPTATDADGDRLTFWVRNKPAWARFDPRTGELRGTPLQSGEHPDIVIGVDDWHTSAALAAFSIHVEPAAERVNEPPLIGGAPAGEVVANTAYAFTPTASDPEGSRLSFDVQNRPAWAAFDASSGRLAGTPTDAQVGVYGNIVISVTDGTTFTSLAPFAVEVTDAPNRPPTIAGVPPPSVTEGQPYSFAPAATDPDGDVMAFSIQNRPTWATFSPSSGRLYGTPGSTYIGSFSNIIISVSDGVASTALPPFTIQVTDAPNRVPVLSGTPSTTAVASTLYAFMPAASDADGDRLTFSISGKPAWASFDSVTGQLSGTPSSTAVGTYSGIVISASDGQATTSLPSFAIRVDPAGQGTVTLSWQAPTHNEDGTLLTDLAGFEVHYGQVAGQYSETLSLPSAGLTSVSIEDLAPATWYFAVKAVNSAGVQSSFSNEATKTIN
jgi:Putative Ig domain